MVSFMSFEGKATRLARMTDNSLELELLPSLNHKSISLAILYQTITAAVCPCLYWPAEIGRTLARDVVHSSAYDVLTLLQITLSRTLPARILCLLPVSESCSD